MQTPVLTAIIVIFILWLQYEIRKSKRLSKKTSDKFWQLEQEANLTRRADISNLDYITLDLNRLPLSDQEDSTVNSYRDSILQLSYKKILKLSGYTNTELKLKYGVANINLLFEYDNNYTILVSILQKWADRLYSLGCLSDAAMVLEYAISCGSDVRTSYKLLAKIYKEQNTPNKIEDLIEVLSKVNTSNKDTTIDELNRIKNS